MSNKCCSGTGKEGKTKDMVEVKKGCVTKLYVKDGVAEDCVWQSCVWKMAWWKMVCDKVVCERWCGERWCVTKLCAKDGVSKMVCDKVVTWCVKDGVWQSGVWKMVPKRAKARHQSQPSAPSATPATRNEGGCQQVPHQPRKVARHPGRQSAPKRATRAGPVPQVLRVPREMKVDVTKCHACHAKWRKTKVDVAKCHAYHAKSRCAQNDVKDGVWQRWCVKDGESWCVTKLVCERCCERCVSKLCVCVKDGLCQSCVWQSCAWVKDGVWQRVVKDGVWQSCVWKMVYDKELCEWEDGRRRRRRSEAAAAG